MQSYKRGRGTEGQRYKEISGTKVQRYKVIRGAEVQRYFGVMRDDCWGFGVAGECV